MRQTNNKKEVKKIIILGAILLTIGLGIGYAILSEQLKLNGSVNYNSMNWEIGFATVSDGNGSVVANTAVSEDKKTITINCNVGTSTKSETCIAKVQIANNSTFAVELESAPEITFNQSYIESVTAKWSDTSSNIGASDTVNASTAKEALITITTKKLDENTLPTEEINAPVNVTMNWIEKK